MKISRHIPMILALGALLASCTEKAQGPSADGLTTLTLNPVIQFGDGTKAAVTPNAEESKVNDIQYYVVGDGEVVAYRHVKGLEAAKFQLDLSRYADWDFFIQVNHPESSVPRHYAAEYRLSEYSRGNMLMSSPANQRFTRDELVGDDLRSDVYLPVYIDLVRFELKDIRLDTNPLSFNPDRFTVKRVFLMNAADDAAETTWLNENGYRSSDGDMVTMEINEDVALSGTHVFRSPSTVYMRHFKAVINGAVTTYTPTVLVLEAEYEQAGTKHTCYYPFELTRSYLTRNTYPVSFSISRHGYDSLTGGLLPVYTSMSIGRWNEDTALTLKD